MCNRATTARGAAEPLLTLLGVRGDQSPLPSYAPPRPTPPHPSSQALNVELAGVTPL
jgi:hypothetical protein